MSVEVEEQKLDDNQFLFADDIVTVYLNYDYLGNNKRVYKAQSWVLTKQVLGRKQKYTNEEIKAVNEELAQKIDEKVAELVKNYAVLKAKKEKLAEEKRIANNTVKIEEFKEFMKKVAPQEFWNFKPVFANPKDYNLNTIDFEGEDWTLTYDKKYDGRDWVVYFKYNDERRYKKLENALKRMQEKIDAREYTKTQEEKKKQILQEVANQTGMTVKTETEWSRSAFGRRGYSIEHLFLVPNEEVKDFHPSIKIEIRQYNDRVEFGEILLYREFSITGEFECTREIKIDSRFKTVEELMTYIKKLHEANVL